MITGGPLVGSGQDTDTGTIQTLATRVDMLEDVNRALDEEQRRIRRDTMYLENVVASIWRATMGPIPDTPEPATPRPRPPVPRPPATSTPEPIPTPTPPPKQPSGPVKKAAKAFESLRGRLGW